MNGIAGYISWIVIIVTGVVSYQGFKNHFFFEKYEFGVDKVRLYKDYKRLVTSGFLHVNWMHLIFNMLGLFFFADLLVGALGPLGFLLVYFASMVGGNLLSLLIYKNQGDYTSVGASGAVNGGIFAIIALDPGIRIFFLPGWLFGLLYIGLTIYGVRSKRDNVGHEAHLGGAMIGMLVAIALQPAALIENWLTILIIAVPTLGFIYLIITRPHILLIDNLFFNMHKNHYSVDHKYNERKFNQQQEIDRILDKISKRGMNSLSQKEKQMLREYSKK
ncbi:rhomboid family intramembrane serine protease [Niastella yeongjuensis]|uniref:Rhomboid family intramembrane serine protease n=1 Tax=Niastella yeongjuensis TaxID=354355 RepID=A0A1V9EMH7_9BACT|nr:rhomboid family intramembrane serine protease [Niastella yeongjuensis]OQP47339.1 rhomboid family intramembrane serine protease [Niastella yeongjuensis]SEN79473.1 Membrane associated serine protease, rhomboid family [Niastella yeongjuensis]